MTQDEARGVVNWKAKHLLRVWKSRGQKGSLALAKRVIQTQIIRAAVARGVPPIAAQLAEATFVPLGTVKKILAAAEGA